MKRILTIVAFCLSLATVSIAQPPQLLSDLGIVQDDELKEVQNRIEAKVDDFQHYVQVLAGGGNLSHEAKIVICEKALDLFIGKGEPFLTRVPNPNGGFTDEIHEAVKMSTINAKYNKKRSSYPMSTYLSTLIKRSESSNYHYKPLVIKTADVVYVDNYSKVEEGRYTATAHILQHFMGYGKDGVQYEDYTVKTITVYIDRIGTDAPDGMDYYWEILLGDVDCDDIW